MTEKTDRESRDMAITISLHQWKYSRRFVNKQQQPSDAVGLPINRNFLGKKFRHFFSISSHSFDRDKSLKIDRRKGSIENRASATSIDRMSKCPNMFEKKFDGFSF